MLLLWSFILLRLFAATNVVVNAVVVVVVIVPT